MHDVEYDSPLLIYYRNTYHISSRLYQLFDKLGIYEQ